MTQLLLIFIGSLATLATIGMFVDFGDDATRILVGFVAALLWGIFGLSSFDVIIADSAAVIRSEPVVPLAYLGIGFAMVLTAFWLYKLMQVLANETGATDMERLTE